MVVQPYQAYTTELDQQIQSKTIKLAKYKKLESFNTDLFETHKKIMYAKSSSDPEQETSLFLKELENIARKSDLHISNMKPGSIENNKTYSRDFVNIRCSCTMDVLAKFLYNLQQSNYLLSVQKMGIASSNDPNESLNADLVVTRVIVAEDKGSKLKKNI